MRKDFGVKRFHPRGTSLDPWVYRFIMTTLFLGLFSNCFRFVLSLHFDSGNIIPFAGTPISIVLVSCLILVLWRKPHLLRTVGTIIFAVITLKIGVLFTYYIFVNQTNFEIQFLGLSALMAINYLIPFIIFRSKIATVFSISTLGLWVMLTGIYVATHWQIGSQRDMLLVVFLQVYVIHGTLIIFMALFVRLRSMYLRSEKSAFHMEKLAHIDFLLGTSNRRSIHVQLQKRLAHRDKSPLSVVLIDIDHFKEINDQYGHNMGDAVLIEVADLISRYSRAFDDFGRWGGEEFLFILPNCPLLDACQVAERIRFHMETNEFQIGQVTASFGVAEFHEGDTVDSLLSRADNALYKCKELGRNRVAIVD